MNANAFAIGIDNGVTGAVCVISSDGVSYTKIPTFKQQNYTKKKGMISRVDHKKLREFLDFIPVTGNNVMCLIERPMVNPGRFTATISALRALEAVLSVIESLGIPYGYIDSREWQKVFLPSGAHKEELKVASKDIGKRFFPQFASEIDKQGDADSFLIAKHCLMKYLK